MTRGMAAVAPTFRQVIHGRPDHCWFASRATPSSGSLMGATDTYCIAEAAIGDITRIKETAFARLAPTRPSSAYGLVYGPRWQDLDCEQGGYVQPLTPTNAIHGSIDTCARHADCTCGWQRWKHLGSCSRSIDLIATAGSCRLIPCFSNWDLWHCSVRRRCGYGSAVGRITTAASLHYFAGFSATDDPAI